MKLSDEDKEAFVKTYASFKNKKNVITVSDFIKKN